METKIKFLRTPRNKEKLYSDLKEILKDQIRIRNLDTPTGWNTFKAKVTDYDKKRRLWVIHDRYKYHYSNRAGDWWVNGSFLCGFEENQYWAVRIPGTITSIDNAVNWLTPTKVKKAKETGKWVCRQGDTYIVQSRFKKDDVESLKSTRHEFRRYGTRAAILHPQHKIIIIPEGMFVKTYIQKQMSSNGSRRHGD